MLFRSVESGQIALEIHWLSFEEKQPLSSNYSCNNHIEEDMIYFNLSKLNLDVENDSKEELEEKMNDFIKGFDLEGTLEKND